MKWDLMFKLNCSSGKCSGIFQNYQRKFPEFLRFFLKHCSAYMPATCKKLQQSQLLNEPFPSKVPSRSTASLQQRSKGILSGENSTCVVTRAAKHVFVDSNFTHTNEISNCTTSTPFLWGKNVGFTQNWVCTL